MVTVVREEACPYCGAYWGHPDPRKNFPNRPKVYDEDGWWWRCYNPDCPVGYYNPRARRVELADSRSVEEGRKKPVIMLEIDQAIRFLRKKGWNIH